MLLGLVFLGYSTLRLGTLIFMSIFLLLSLIILLVCRIVLQVQSSRIKPDIERNIKKDGLFYFIVKLISVKPVSLCMIFIGVLLACFLGLNALSAFQMVRVKQKERINAIVKVMRIFEKNIRVKVISSTTASKFSGYSLSIYKTKQNEDLILGGIYQATLTLSPMVDSINPNQRSFIYYQISNKIVGRAKIETIQLIQSADFISQSRIKLDEYLNENYENGVLLSALTTGITRNMSQSDWRLFRETGTIHLISISGLHLSIVAGWLFIGLRFIFGMLNSRKVAPFMIAAIGSIIISVLYALFAGLGLPIIRALIMFSITMLCLIFRGRLLSFNSIATALFIVLIFWPLSVFQAGFWLSFFAVTCFILHAHVAALPRHQEAVVSIWFSIFKVQLYLSLILMPLTAHFFGTISVISPFTNILAIPFTTIFIMPPLMLGVMIRFLSDSQITRDLAADLFTISDYAVGVLRHCLLRFTHIPYHEISLSLGAIEWAVLFTIILMILCFYPKHLIYYLRKIVMSLCLFISVIYKILFLLKNNFKIKYLIVFLIGLCGLTYVGLLLSQMNPPNLKARLVGFPSGEGLSFFIQLNQFNMLYDNGRYFRGVETAKQVILPNFNYLKIKSLDYMILSIDNNQHIGGTKTMRTAFPDVKIAAHPTLMRYINAAFDCTNDEDLQKIVSDYFSQYPNHFLTYPHSVSENDFSLNALPIVSSCGLNMRIGRYNIWLLSDISIKEWSHLTDLLMQKVLTVPDIILMPNQGRSPGFILSKALKEHPDLLIILSTRQINKQLLDEINDNNINMLNSNDGLIILDLSHNKLQYKQDRMIDRHWWLG